MKLRKGRGASRTLAADAEPLFVAGPNNTIDVRRHKTTPFGLFDSFRKVARGGGGAAPVVQPPASPPVVDEDETRLLKKGSYTHSEKTEPTAAMTTISESMSAVSSVSSEIIGKAFAIFQTPSENTEIQFTHNFEDMLELEKSSAGGGTSHNTKLSRASLDILEAVQLQKEFSNMQFRTQSMKVVEYNAEPPLQTIEDEVQQAPAEPDGLQLRTDSLKVVEYHSESPSFDEDFFELDRSEVTFDPDRYLMEYESRHEPPSAPTADVWRSVDPPDGRDDLGSMMSAHRSVTANEYVSASSSSEEEGDEVDDDAGTEADKEDEEERSTLLSPLHSPGSSSTSSSESVWEKGSSGNQSRERSLLDVINTEPEERMVDEEQDAGHTDSDDCSTVDFGDGVHSVEDGGTIEGPDSPLSFGSSVVLDEYEELDALAALTGLFVNIVTCNVNDLAAIGDEEDDYSVVEIDHPFPAVGVEVPTQRPAMKSVANRVPTPPAAKPTSFWGMVFSCV